MKKILLLLIFWFSIINTFSQTNDEKAKAAYFAALNAFNSNQFQSSVDNLKNAISILGSTNVKIQDLLVRSYVGLNNFQQAKIEIEKYFNLKPVTDESYNEILLLSQKIEQELNKLQKEKEKKDLELAAWNNACEKNTKDAFNSYLASYPSGTYVSNAKNKIDELEWALACKNNNLQSYKDYLSLYPNGIYKSTAKEKIKSFEDDNNYNKCRDAGNLAYNQQDWVNAKTEYEKALKFKPDNEYVKDKLKLVNNEIQKIENQKNKSDMLLQADNLNKMGSRNYFRGTRYLIGGLAMTGLGGYWVVNEFFNYDGNVLLGSSGLTLLNFGVAAVGISFKYFHEASNQKQEAKELRKKANSISFIPVINPMDKTYQLGLVLRFK